jgi:hypothetical protein
VGWCLMTPRLRLSPEGVVAVYDDRYSHGMPWRVVHVPPGVTANWPTQLLPDQAVGVWQVLVPREVP